MHSSNDNGQIQTRQSSTSGDSTRVRAAKNSRRGRPRTGENSAVVSFRLISSDAEILTRHRAEVQKMIEETIQKIREDEQKNLWKLVGEELANDPYEWEENWVKAGTKDASRNWPE